MYTYIYTCTYIYMHMYVGSKYGFAQSMDCTYRYIQYCKSNFILFYIIILLFFYPCMCMACIKLAIHLRHVVYPRTGPAIKPGSPLVWRNHMRGCGYIRQGHLLNRRPRDAETPPWTETGSDSLFSGLLLNGRQNAARW